MTTTSSKHNLLSTLYSHRLFVLFILFLGLITYLNFFRPPTTKGALNNITATLSNSRFSFSAKVSGSVAVSSIAIGISSGNSGDNNTSHLFPNDTVSVGSNGAKTVGSILNSTSFTVTQPLAAGMAAGAPIYATQSGTLTVSFALANSIPPSGYVQVAIPAPNDTAGNNNDGAPQPQTSVANNGFDANALANTNTVTTGGDGCTWAADTASETWTVGASGTKHLYKNITSTACSSGTVSITLGDGTKGLVNPAPSGTSHTLGVADVYTVSVSLFNSNGQSFDSTDVKIAPVEGVLMSAYVDETLQFTVAGVATGVTFCGAGNSADVTTTATSIPWGTIASGTVKNAAQKITVVTNAPSGYTVTIDENDQMGREGRTCTGSPTDPITTQCIVDSRGVGNSMSSSVSDRCEGGSVYGNCFSLQSLTVGTSYAANFLYNTTSGYCAGGSFCARVPADLEASQTAQQIFENNAPTASDQTYICYRINIPGTQPAGDYWNKIKYTVSTTF